jgi:hypothetical protein
MGLDWKQRARHDLMKLRGSGPAWGYRPGGASSVEPTALACLALLYSGDERSFETDRHACRAGADWMAAIQRAEGALPVSRDLGAPGWTTSYAVFLWSELPGYEAARKRALAWLLGIAGKTLARTKVSDELIGKCSRAAGWPWVDGTHSWLEPTALAVLALCRSGLADHPRADAGIELILDRAIAQGGWNYGNTRVFGRDLRPQPGPTGLALLALAARGDGSPAVARAVDYLLAGLPAIGAAVSLGWGVLGLRAHRASPPQAEEWLEAAYRKCIGRADAAMGLALLLLAAGGAGLGLLVRPTGDSAAVPNQPSSFASENSRSGS